MKPRFDKATREAIHTALSYVVRTCIESRGKEWEGFAGMSDEEMGVEIEKLERALKWIGRERVKRGDF